jgi:hypothetical protein
MSATAPITAPAKQYHMDGDRESNRQPVVDDGQTLIRGRFGRHTGPAGQAISHRTPIAADQGTHYR